MRAPRIRTRTGVTAGIAAATLLLAACGSSGGGASTASADTLSSMAKLSASQLQSKAEQEGQVNWYTTFAADDVNDMVAAFNKTYPKIKVNALRLSADQLPPRVITEQRGNEFNADVVSGDAPQVDQLISSAAAAGCGALRATSTGVNDVGSGSGLTNAILVGSLRSSLADL